MTKFTFRGHESFKKDKSHHPSHQVTLVIKEVSKEMTRVPNGPDLWELCNLFLNAHDKNDPDKMQIE